MLSEQRLPTRQVAPWLAASGADRVGSLTQRGQVLPRGGRTICRESQRVGGHRAARPIIGCPLLLYTASWGDLHHPRSRSTRGCSGISDLPRMPTPKCWNKHRGCHSTRCYNLVRIL